jgi:hypothetical protein
VIFCVKAERVYKGCYPFFSAKNSLKLRWFKKTGLVFAVARDEL